MISDRPPSSHMSLDLNTYLYVSAIVGIAQVVDAYALTKHKGQTGIVSTVFSFGEYVWATVSFYAWKKAEEPFPEWLPISFIAYVASFFAAGLLLVLQHRGPTALFAIPNHLVVAGGIFGMYFALASLFHAVAS